MSKSRKQICIEMVGGNVSAKKINSFEEVLEYIQKKYPNAYRQGASGGWSWVDEKGVVVASSCFIMSYPYGRHWLAMRSN